MTSLGDAGASCLGYFGGSFSPDGTHIVAHGFTGALHMGAVPSFISHLFIYLIYNGAGALCMGAVASFIFVTLCMGAVTSFISHLFIHFIYNGAGALCMGAVASFIYYIVNLL